MKYLKEYYEFDNNSNVEEICNKYGITNFTVRDGDVVDVDGDVNLSNKGLTELPLNFGTVTGNFDCNSNKIKTLEGCPKLVGGDFIFYKNWLSTLEGAPEEVGGNFDCRANKLVSLEGSPSKINGDFACGYNWLSDLVGGPTEVVGNFYCDNQSKSGNPKTLTTLEGAPKYVGGNFGCFSNALTNFDGAPEKVGGHLYFYNNKITTLERMPYTEGDIKISNNPLPKEILKLSSEQIKKVVEEQDFYEIWREGKLFEPRWKELKIDLNI